MRQEFLIKTRYIDDHGLHIVNECLSTFLVARFSIFDCVRQHHHQSGGEWFNLEMERRYNQQYDHREGYEPWEKEN
jgi:hypothetical protein